jgi:hypothetical protein
MPILKNQRHEAAVQESMKPDVSQSDAFRFVYPNSKKWKDETVWNKSSALFRRADVLARIEELRATLADKEIISKEEIIKDLQIIAKVSIRDFVLSVKAGIIEYKNPDDWTDAMARACTDYKNGKNGIEISVYGMKYSYDRISKMVGYDAPIKSNVEISSTLADLLK